MTDLFATVQQGNSIINELYSNKTQEKKTGQNETQWEKN